MSEVFFPVDRCSLFQYAQNRLMAEVEDAMKVRSRTYQYTVNFEEAEDGVIIVTVPLLRGCVSYGYTIEEAEGNIREAIECYIETLPLA